MARPHIARDDDIVECFGAVSNFLTCVWLTVPVLLQGTVLSLFSDQYAMLLALASTGFAACMSMVQPLVGIFQWLGNISNLCDFLGIAKDGILMFLVYIGAIAESEMRDKMRRKFLRDRGLEERSIRLQLLLHTSVSEIVQAIRLPSRNIQEYTSDALGFSAHPHEKKIQNLQRAIAMLADVKPNDVNVELTRGPNYDEWLGAVGQEEATLQQHGIVNSRSLVEAFLMSQHTRLGARSVVPRLEDKILLLCGGYDAMAEESRTQSVNAAGTATSRLMTM